MNALGIANMILYAVLVYIAANYSVMLIGSVTYRPPLSKAARQPKVSVIIPTKDEEAVLEETLRSLQGSYKNLEIVVVDSSSRPNTRKIARRYGAVVVADKAGKGKSYAVNMGVKKAGGEYIYFIDADCRVAKSTIRSMLASIGDSPACTGFVVAQAGSFVSLMGKLETLFLNATNYWTSLAINTSFIIGRNFMVRKKDLLSVGNFDNVLSEDINLSYKLYKNRKKVVFNPGAICVESSPKKIAHYFRQQERWGAGSFHEIRNAFALYPLHSLTLFFVALFYVFSPLFLALSFVNPVFALPAVPGIAVILYFSARYLKKSEMLLLPAALLVMEAVFTVVMFSLIAKKVSGVSVGWYKTPR